MSLKDKPQRKSALGTDENLQDWVVPVLFESVSVTPLAKPAAGPSESAGAAEAEEFGVPKPPEYGFHGRDNVTLRLERVFQHNTVALLWGMAGVGKTTTAAAFARWWARAFARWWARTGALEGPVFFFSFEYHKTLAAVVGEIGRAYQGMLKANGYGEWKLLSPARQRRCVLDLLTQVPCFVIFDNFEPVSGFPTGTPSVWTTEEQDELREFLAELTRRKAASKVLVTSRRETEPTLPACPKVPLGGLPRHEALEMAGAILTRHGLAPAKIRQLPAFDDLLKFLNGNPLSLQVILPLLADGKKPEALLAKLQAGTVALPASDTTEQGRDASLSASLTYRLESLSPIDTARLSVVGLFQGFVNAQVLAGISRADDAPSEIRGLSTDEWIRVLSVAAETGLMRVEGKGYFTVHPALPWFFHESLSVTFGHCLPTLERLFIQVYGGYGGWLNQTFQTQPQAVMSLLSAEEPNLLYALQLSRTQQQDETTAGNLYGIERLWTTQGRWEAFHRLLHRIESEIQNSIGESQSGRDYLWVACLGMRKQIAFHRRDFVTVKKVALRLKAHFEINGDKQNLATCLDSLAYLAFLQRDWEESESIYDLVLRIYQSLNDPKQSIPLHQLGMIAEKRRDFEEAENRFKQSLQIAQSVGNDNSASSTLHHLGKIAEERRDFDQAENLFRQSLEIKQRIGNKYREAVTLHHLGRVAEERKNFAEAESWYRKSLNIAKITGDAIGEAMTLHQLGRVAQERENFDEAEQWYRESLRINIEIQNEHDSAINIHQLGVIAQERGDLDAAEQLFQQSIEIKGRVRDEHGMASSTHQLGAISAEQGKFEKAKQLFRQAEEIFLKTNDSDGHAMEQDSLSRLAAKQND